MRAFRFLTAFVALPVLAGCGASAFNPEELGKVVDQSIGRPSGGALSGRAVAFSVRDLRIIHRDFIEGGSKLGAALRQAAAPRVFAHLVMSERVKREGGRIDHAASPVVNVGIIEFFNGKVRPSRDKGLFGKTLVKSDFAILVTVRDASGSVLYERKFGESSRGDASLLGGAPYRETLYLAVGKVLDGLFSDKRFLRVIGRRPV